MPTGIWSSRLTSGSAHWNLELAVEVRQCPLGSGARGGGPAVPTGIWTARRRRRVRRRRRQRRQRRRRRWRRRKRALLKSSNPHLAGGESPCYSWVNQRTVDWASYSSSQIVNVYQAGYPQKLQPPLAPPQPPPAMAVATFAGYSPARAVASSQAGNPFHEESASSGVGRKHRRSEERVPDTTTTSQHGHCCLLTAWLHGFERQYGLSEDLSVRGMSHLQNSD